MTHFEARPIIALDFPNDQEVKSFLAKFPTEEKLFVKVGMELFYQEGPEIVRYLKSLGYSIFLDLKLHDIPNTVKSAMKVLAGYGVDIVDLHAAGGIEMMQAAKAGLLEGTPAKQEPAKILAVTQLTSTNEKMMQQNQLITASLAESVAHYAQCSKTAGLDGVVCSALEVEAIRAATDQEFTCLTPGIRPAGSQVGDQKRVVTPEQARIIGSTYIVVGRPITQAENPLAAYQSIKEEWNQ